MNKKTQKLMHLTFALLIVLTFSGCKLNTSSENQFMKNKQITLDSEQEANAKIKTEVLQNRMLQLIITIPAQFKPINKFLDRIYDPVAGKVTNVYVEPGMIVKKGQPLIEIKSDEIGQIQLAFLDEFIVVDSNVKQMTAQYNLAKQTYKRESTLYKEGISSRAEYEVAYAQLLKDRANLNSLKSQRSTLVKVYAQRVALYGGSEGTITQAIASKRIYPYVTLRANKNGVVLTRRVNTGEIIDKDKELFSIADLSSVWLVGYAFEKDAPLLRKGQEVIGVMEEHQEQNIKGTLSYVASMLDEERKTLEVIATIPNPNYTIKPNMYAEMIVNIGEISALAVPNAALQKYGDYTFAYVKVRPHVYEERKVEVGQHNEKYSQVKSGLKEGEVVVTDGAYSLLGEAIKLKG